MTSEENSVEQKPFTFVPDPRFATVEEWAEWRYRQGQVVPEGHPAHEPWMSTFH